MIARNKVGVLSLGRGGERFWLRPCLPLQGLDPRLKGYPCHTAGLEMGDCARGPGSASRARCPLSESFSGALRSSFESADRPISEVCLYPIFSVLVPVCRTPSSVTVFLALSESLPLFSVETLHLSGFLFVRLRISFSISLFLPPPVSLQSLRSFSLPPSLAGLAGLYQQAAPGTSVNEP